MATGFPVKANYATGDVLTAANMNDLAGTLNYLDPTAKGDLFPASDGSTLTRLAVGTNGQVLTADSTATTGMKWATVTGSGTTFISTTTFSGVSSQLITGLTTTYSNYLLVGNIQASTGMTLRGRFSVSGTPATGGSYSYTTYGKTSGNSDLSLYATSATYFEIATIGSDSQYLNMTIFDPNQTSRRKAAVWQEVGLNSAYSPSYFTGGAWLDISGTAYNEIQLIPSTGTISGTVSLYGFNK